jgi:hypothetical protein
MASRLQGAEAKHIDVVAENEMREVRLKCLNVQHATGKVPAVIVAEAARAR